MTQKALLQSAGDGTAVPQGYVGEVVNGSSDATTTMAATLADKTISTITLSPGVWRIDARGLVDPALVTGFTRGQLTITTGTTTSGVTGYDNGDCITGLSGGYHTALAYLYANISSQTTYNMVFKGTFSSQSGSPVRVVARAVRIA